MQHEEQVAIVRRILTHLDAKTTDLSPAIGRNPVEAYFSEEWRALEVRHLFNRHSQVLGLSGLLPEAGDYLVDDLSGRSLLFVRTPAGPVHGFLNVCRHRGAPLAQACGHGAKRLTCPYHGLTYDLEGLPVTLNAAHYPDVSASDLRLSRVRLHEAHGMLWLHPGPNDTAIALHDIAQQLDDYQLGSFTHYQSRRLQRRMNWKMVIDTFLESAHFSFLHRNSIASLFIPNLGIFDTFGRNSRIVYPRATIQQVRGTPPDRWDLLRHSVIIYMLFPNTLLLWQLDHVELWRVYPDPAGDPGCCVTEVSLYIPQPATTDKARAHWDANMQLAINAVVQEDFPVAEAIQQGLRSGAQTHLTFGRHEPALIHFHQQLELAMASEPPGP